MIRHLHSQIHNSIVIVFRVFFVNTAVEQEPGRFAKPFPEVSQKGIEFPDVTFDQRLLQNLAESVGDFPFVLCRGVFGAV